MIDLVNVSLQFGGKYLFKDVNYKISSGDKISLVGANGTGKSSLLKIISGLLPPESGNILKQKRISIGYLPQDHVTHSGKTLLQEASTALSDIIELQNKETELTESLNNPDLTEDEQMDIVHQLGEVHHMLEGLDSYSAQSKVEKILIGLGFDEDDFDRYTDEFSGGWQMRIALAKILISQNDILLLDEPTNHLDIDSLEWLIDFLKAYKGGLLIVSHDKNFVNQVTNRTLEIFLGKFYTFKGDYDSYLKYKTERDELTVQQFEQQQKKIKETEKFIERFRYKATKSRQVQSRIKQLDKVELIELPEDKSEINIKFPEPPQSGRTPMKLQTIFKSYGDKKVFEGIDFEIEKGEKIAFVGPNGAGKSTLAKIIAGVIDFNSGEKILGHNAIVSYYAQDVADNLNPDLEIIETVDGIAVEKTIGQLRSLLGSFLFSGDDVFKKVGVLSGGEKSRIALCKILLTKANFIILDEPTNHLDYTSKLILQKALLDFKGTLILVSHDVDFLRPIATKVIDIRKGHLKTYLGGIDYFFSKRDFSSLERDGAIKEKEKKTVVTTVNRKEQKRIEAELRQQKHVATKDLVKEISKWEEKINLKEIEINNLETMLADPAIYNDGILAKETTVKFNKTKSELDSATKKWEELTEKLLEIESQFT
ncbi:MAG: ABC-F family ATP-binding cassette domain-containing protein [Ignavibacteriales bacterium]|nr:ABC-F family ATP-binding cassette domain-containing protein [Ignavibacteriales bacterium]